MSTFSPSSMHPHPCTNIGLPYLTPNTIRWVPILVALVNGTSSTVRWLVFLIKVKVIHTTRGMRKEWRTSNKGTSLGSIDFVAHKFGTLFGFGRKQPSFGSFGIRQLRLVNGGHTLLWRPFPNNVFYCLLS
jgi:hypothetical protein